MAIFDAANRIVFLITTFLSYIFASFYPALVKVKAEGKDVDFSMIAEKITRYLCVLAVCTAFSITIASSLITSFLYGPAYQDSTFLLQILAWRLIFYCFSSIYTSLMYIYNHQRKWMIIVIGLSIINLLSSIILIYNFNLSGAAISTLVTEVLVAVFLGVFTNKKYRVMHSQILVKLAITALIPIIIIFIPNIQIFIKLTLGLSLYAIAVILAKIITFKEIAAILKETYHRIYQKNRHLGK